MVLLVFWRTCVTVTSSCCICYVICYVSLLCISIMGYVKLMLALVFITAIQLSGLLLSDCLEGRNFSSWVQRIPPIKIPGSLQHPQVWHADSENTLNGQGRIWPNSCWNLHRWLLYRKSSGKPVSYLQSQCWRKDEKERKETKPFHASDSSSSELTLLPSALHAHDLT